jgi:heme/copper-type cytochrome/quinol oxidase subunit 1
MAEPWATISTYALILWIAMGAFAVVVLWRHYLADRSYRQRRGMPSGFVSATLAILGTMSYPAAAWGAFLQIRRLSDQPSLEWSPIVTTPLFIVGLSVAIVAAGVLLYQRFRY